jgi:hypothetical protein
MPVLRARKTRDENGKCGSQPADESVINRRPIGSRHTGQVEINRRRCKLGDVVLCSLTPMTVMRAGISAVMPTEPLGSAIVAAEE